MFKPKLPKQNEGFTLVEVLVAILIASMFVGVAMQAITIAAIFKARAQEYTEATAWIQEDLEDIKDQAANFTLPSTSLTANVTSVAGVNTVLTVASAAGFAATNNLIIGSDSTSNTIASVDTVANTITLNAPLGSDWLANTVVVATSPMCDAATVTRTTGFADSLRDKVTTIDSTNGFTVTTNTNDSISVIQKNSKLTQKLFTMTRTATLSLTAPFNLLEIRYIVTPTGSRSVADFYTEVLPNAVFQCP